MTDPGNYTTAQNEATNIDHVVISHEHTDHLHVESLKTVLKNNPKATVISNSSVGKILEKEGIAFSIVGHEEKIVVGDVEIAGYGMKHAPIYKGYEQVENTGYMFDGKFFYPGDAFYDPGVPVDILALPITAPWLKISEPLDYALAIKPRVVFPVHDGNLIRHGLTTRLPALFFEPAGIQFITLEIGKETEL